MSVETRLTAEQFMREMFTRLKECGVTLMAFDPDSEQYEKVTGYLYDPTHRTIELQTDDAS